MRVFLDRIGDLAPWHDHHVRMLQLAEMDKVGEHTLTPTRASADLVLAIVNGDPRFHRLEVDHRVRVFCTYDIGFPWLPGIYPSLPTSNSSRLFARSGPYLPQPWEHIPQAEPEFLFSFVGSSLTSPIRQRILALKHPRAFLRDSSGSNAYKSAQPQTVYQEFRDSYRRLLVQSKFVLCPRGVGASSVRLFETMRAGRVPVIVSDAFVPPEGVPWDTFSVRIPEMEIATIPARLEELEGQASEMGARARECWDANFSETTVFHWMVEQARQLASPTSASFRVWRAMRLIFHDNFRSVLLPIVKKRLLRVLSRESV